ncbi:MAG: cation transporting ATPase C-terminal domain-containing protein, partial [Chitinophagales bacterium]|nr:cation transporting ATPase C-terminal domain-containing protein [Chitinophagales bacterium]
QNGASEETTRAIVFTTLIFANVFLSLTNRSFTYSLFESFKNKNTLFPLIIGSTLILLFAILYIPVFSNFFHVSSLNLKDLGIAILIAMVSVLWFEVYKWGKRNSNKK